MCVCGAGGGGGGGSTQRVGMFDVHWSPFKVKVTTWLLVARTGPLEPMREEITKGQMTAPKTFKVEQKELAHLDVS